jgi:hypothetical protein
MFKQGAGNGFFWLRDTHLILQTQCSLHIKVLLVKLNTLHPEYHILIVFSAKIIIRPTSKKKSHGNRPRERGDHNSLLVILSPKTFPKRGTHTFSEI